MIPATSLWIVFTLVGAIAQTARNAMQRELTATLGTAGATHVRFLFGLPFGLIFLALTLFWSGHGLPAIPSVFWPWLIAGALSQILGTALMLAAMGERSFVVTTAYIKTEPVQVALFGFVFLGDALSWPMLAAIVVATIGVVITAFKARNGETATGLRPTLQGLLAGGFFALSAVCFRGAIIALPDVPFFVAASTALVASLGVQTGVLSTYLAWRECGVLMQIMRAWRPSLFAGFMGALGSQFWFLAFSLTAAANVRTLALIEVLFAQLISRFIFGQRTGLREGIGIGLMLIGVAMLLMWH